MSALLEIKELSVDYSSHGRWVPALRNFSLTLEPGEAVGLVGPSGSGKSTAALAILRLIRPGEGRVTSGRILFQGKNLLDLREDEMRRVRGRDIAMIFQDPFSSLNPVLRIEDQLGETLAAHQLPCSPEILRGALQQVQLDASILGRYPHQLSGGQRQRVMIAMALLCRPSLILADEPTTALDVLVQKEVLDVLFRLQRETGLALLCITHNLPMVARRAQRVVRMRRTAD